MSKPFDATTKELLEGYPGPWLAYLGIVPDGPIRVIDTNLATVTAEADKVYLVEGPNPYLIHVELQASADRTLPRRQLRYNTLLDVRHDLRVLSVAVLLRPQAETDNLTGVLDLRLPDGHRIVEFRYEVVRAWEQAVEPILCGSLGTLPMAPLADVPLDRVPAIIERIDKRLIQEAPAAVAGKIIGATLLLAGLRLEMGEIQALCGRLQTMNIATESSYYRLIIEEGMIEGARRMILKIGSIRFGTPAEKVRTTIEAITDVDRLEQLGERLETVTSWAELLAESQEMSHGG